MTDELPKLLFTTEAAWEAWLAEHHETAPGVWVKIAKKGGGKESISYAQALEVALCYGWIDSQKGKFDDEYFVQKFTPRRAGSIWSAVNRDKVNALIAAGRMRTAGLREIENAKANGRWDAAYQSQSKATIPSDLQAALDANPTAKAFFEALDGVNRYAILFRIQNVKKAETRQKKIAQYIEMLAEGKKIYE